jgi:diguanylate cyclase (GGDEF)-like protein
MRRPTASAGELMTIGRLRAVLERTAAVRGERDLPGVLEEVARAVGEALGYRTAVINIYRPAYDDFQTAAVHGSERSRAQLLGTESRMETWTPLLDERFNRRGAYLIADEEFDWEALGVETYVPDLKPSSDPDAWGAGDALFVPLRGRDGGMLGILSVDEPLSGRRPHERELDALVAMAQHAALAIRIGQETAADAQHQLMLEGVLEVSARLAGAGDSDTVLQAVCEGIRDALAFDKVVIALIGEDAGALLPVAAAGWAPDVSVLDGELTLELLEPLLVPPFEVAGCYLVPHEAAVATLGARRIQHRSALNGRGPHAWSGHLLLVPLDDSEGRRQGMIWVDDPRDRLLPTRARLQALRLFANQAVAALRSADRVGRLRHEATHDPLTGLANRRAFLERLSQETARADRHGGSFALVLCDMNGLKAINDTYGHSAGDRALCLLAEVLRGGLRRSDEAYRLGGDEFALVLADADRGDADRVVDRLQRGLAGGGVAPVGTVEACFGIAVHQPGQAQAQLVSEADRTLYLAKREHASATG